MKYTKKNKDLSLPLDLYELTMAQVYFKTMPQATAAFEVFIRSPKRPFYIICGIENLIEQLTQFSFSSEDISYLESLNLFEKDFLNYLKKFKFQCDLWAVEDPEILFAGEPILRIKGNIIQTQLLETLILNRLNTAITFATKAYRIVQAAKGRMVFDFSFRRTQGLEASLAIAYYSYLAGVNGTSNLMAGLKYNIPVVGTMAHSFIMSFPHELDSFYAFAKQYPEKSILLIDTYDIKNGLMNALKIANYLRKRGHNLLGIRIDSGNLAQEAKQIRRLLDSCGLIDVIIVASGDLDEYKINQLIEEKAPIDAFGVGTHMGCSSDLPFSDIIYKMVSLSKEPNKKYIPVMKTSSNKTSLPGEKQIFRKKYTEDIIGLSNEKCKGEKLLLKLVEKGNKLFAPKSLQEKRFILQKKLSSFSEEYLKIQPSKKYPVYFSNKLISLTKQASDSIHSKSAKKIIFLDIDTQQDFILPKGKLYVPEAEKIIINLKLLTNFAQNNNILIISSQDTHCLNDPEFKNFPAHCIKKTNGHKKIKQTNLNKKKIVLSEKYNQLLFQKVLANIDKYSQIIVQKKTINLFENPWAVKLIDSYLAHEIYIYGVATDYCVKAAVDFLIQHNLVSDLYLVTDAIKAIDPNQEQKLLSLWKKQGVKLIETNSVLKNILPK